MNKVLPIILRLLSTLIPLAFLYTVYWLFHEFDYFRPVMKLIAFSAVFLVIVIFQLLEFRRKAPPAALWIEIAMLSVLLATIFVVHGGEYAAKTFDAPVSDIGYTTVHAAWSVVNDQRNPYSRADINHTRLDLPQEYRGYHYGPVMILGYLPSAWAPAVGYKAMSLIYLLVTLFLLVLLIRKPDESWPERIANILFVFTAYFMAKRFWIEMIPEGANDIFHIMLILAALYALKKDRIFWAGMLTGLSCGAKCAPGMFLIPFMPLRQKGFWLGLALGLSPYIPFALWDASGLWHNAFWLRVIIDDDGTGLYWITPKPWQWIFGVITLSAVVASVAWAVRRRLEYPAVLAGFTLLMMIGDITQRQVHGNHLIWFYPVFAILFMGYREQLFGLFSSRNSLTEP